MNNTTISGNRPKRFGPPNRRNGGNMPQFTEEDLVIMPDFSRLRMALMMADFAYVIISFVLEILLFLFLQASGDIDNPLKYLLKNVALPTSISLAILFVGLFIIKKRKNLRFDMPLNVIPIFSQIFMNFTLCLFYHNYYCVLCIFCIPILMTSSFCNKILCKITTVLSTTCVLITLAVHMHALGNRIMPEVFYAESALSLAVIVISSWISHIILSMTDAQRTKLNNFAREIKEAQISERAANKAKSEFLANMSHEIRTPINAIIGMNEMILREESNPQITDYADNIQSASNSLLAIINDILDISKIESGKLDLVENTYELYSLIHDSYSLISDRANAKGLELAIECDSKLPSKLSGDETRIRQVIINLLSNAVKYTHRGCITLNVSGETRENEFNLILSVKDTGIGIKEENLNNLFTQFTRFDLEKNRNIEGTGLGLAITNQLLTLMNGQIDVKSTYGLGSVFTATIPQKVVDSAPIGEFKMNFHNSGVQHNNISNSVLLTKNTRILAVDDVSVNLKVFSSLLKGTNIKIDTAESGQECLDLVTKYAYDMIFMDHMMPVMDGIETYKRMRKMSDSINKDTPVIMLTANAVTGMREQYLSEGFADYISKPIRSNKLIDMIVKFLPKEKVVSSAGTTVAGDASAGGASGAGGGAVDAGGGVGSGAGASVAGSASVSGDNASAESDNNRYAQSDITARLLAEYPSVDIPQALSYCGDDIDSYKEILQIYVDSDFSKDLEKHYEERNTHDYQIVVHGVKSSSLSIGFKDIYDDALSLENAAKGEDWDYIGNHHKLFIEKYQKAIKAIATALK